MEELLQMYDALPRLRPYRVRGANLSTPEGHQPLLAGKPVVLLETKGAGQITRLHITVGHWDRNDRNLLPDPQLYRNVVLRIYWDGEKRPSVLCPLGDFFCDPFCGAGTQFSTPFFCNYGAHLVCYLPMPFARGCRIELENQGESNDRLIACDVLYQEWNECPDDLARFHACWRRENPTTPGQPYTVLRTTGRGHYVGCNLSVQTYGRPNLSFLEGIARVYVDGQPDPAYKLWGTEDYFGGSWYFARGAFTGPFAGCTLLEPNLGRFAGYRLHLPDAIPFEREISVELNHGDCLNSGPIFNYDGRADYSSVAYWYQTGPRDDATYQGHSAAERRLSGITISPGAPTGSLRPEWYRPAARIEST
jgi:D-arabinan exo alpha-(1,3)/(1,5)-arabinofuranosidase (non-reducing end)